MAIKFGVQLPLKRRTFRLQYFTMCREWHAPLLLILTCWLGLSMSPGDTGVGSSTMLARGALHSNEKKATIMNSSFMFSRWEAQQTAPS